MKRGNAVKSFLHVLITLLLIWGGCGSGGGSSEDNGSNSSMWVRMEMDGIVETGPFFVVSGPGYDISRIPGFDGTGNPNDLPGLASERQFIFEARDEEASEFKTYFNSYLANPATGSRNASLIILTRSVSESFRWDFAGFIPSGLYEEVEGGRTRFTLVQSQPADRVMRWVIPGSDPFGTSSSFNPSTDRFVEVDGIVTVYPAVSINESQRTLTLTYDFVEAGGIYAWVENIIEGRDDIRNLSIIDRDEGGSETGRTNYSGCFPIKFEHTGGYDIDLNVKLKIVLSYNTSQRI